jgi:hypothetical protein
VHAEEKLTAFVELELAIRAVSLYIKSVHRAGGQRVSTASLYRLGTVGKNSVKRCERCPADALLDIKFGRIRGDSGYA